MRNALSGRGVILAGVLMLAAAGPAGAQFSGPSSAPQEVTTQAVGAWQASDENQNRLAEIAVELAWLADPMVCPFYPCARAAGGSLAVGGFVPDEKIRLLVLQLARRNCSLPIVDRLKVYAGLAASPVRVPAAQLADTARQILGAEFPTDSPTFQITCSPTGQLILRGRIASFEDKLKVSQRLRRLPGCNAVVNFLQVTINDENLTPPALSSGPGTPAISPRGRATFYSSPLMPGQEQPGGGQPTIPEQPPAALPGPAQHQWTPGPGVEDGPKPAPAPELQPAQESREEEGLAVPEPLAAPAETKSAPAAEPPPLPVPAPAETKTAPTAEPLLLSVPVPVPIVPESRPDRAGKVSAVAPDSHQQPVPRLTPAQLQVRLAERIKAACPEAQDVKVTFTSGLGLHVRLLATETADRENLSTRVRALPELSPFLLQVEVLTGK
jgi:hypothetical protein